MSKSTRILIVEDLAADADLAKHAIRKALKHCEFQVVTTREEFLQALQSFQPDVILSDYSLPRFDGMKALKLTLKHAPLTPLIVWTGSMSEDIAVDCMKAGATNYILKDNIKRLGPAVVHALEERQLLLERRQAEEKYQAIFENSAQGIFQSTPAGRYLSVNPAMARIYGYDSPADMIASVTDIARQIYVEPADQNNFRRLLAEHDILNDYEQKNYRRDGSIIWTSTSARVVRDAAGNILYYEGFLQDITARRQMEESLTEERNLLRTLIDNLPDRIYVMDSEGHKRISNTADWKASGGRTMEDVLGKTDLETYPAALAEEFWRLDRTVLDSGIAVINHEEPGFDSEGNPVWVLSTKVPLKDSQGKVQGLVGIGRDITERKQNESRINDLLALNEKILNYSPLGILTYKVTGECIFANEKAAQIVGTEVEQLKAQNFHTIESWKKSGLYGLVERAIATGTVVTADIHHLSTFGKDLWMTVHCVTFKSKDEGHVLLSISDITERKQAESELRASEERFRQLANNIQEVFWMTDVETGQDIYISPAAAAIWDRPVASMLNDPQVYINTVLPEDRPLVSQSLARLKRGEKMELEYRITRPDDSVRWLWDRGFPIFDDSGNVLRIAGITTDITERRQNEADRKRSGIIMQKRLELMEYSRSHTLSELMQKTTDEISDLTGSTAGFFHFVEADQIALGVQTWSTNALELCRLPPGEAMHLPLDQAGLWAEAVRQRRPLIQNDCASLIQANGLPEGHVPVEREIVIPVLRNERIVAVMGIANKPRDYTPDDLEIAERLADYAWDITERKQMEAALEDERNQLARRVQERTADLSRANVELARALRVKDEFLANMSHELRTPLNAILGLSESLGEQIAGPLNEKQQKYITTISESGHHLLSLINDILDLAKIESGQIALDMTTVDVHAVCQASLRMIKQLAHKKNQDVTLTIDGDLGLVRADERRLKQMIVNLLGNAVKFTPENGRLGLEVHGHPDVDQITIAVWDEGIGIRQEDLARLFQPFVQLDSGLARETTGTGLGLALVAQMARLHGGSVSAVSEPNVGSRFTIILPWEPGLSEDADPRSRMTGKFRAIKPSQTDQPTILLVEDTPEVNMMIRDYLELAGYRVVVAVDGVEAIAQAHLTHPDLILMDVQLPGLNGLQVTRKLRSEAEFRYTPIVALTALAMPSDRERCLEAGMDEYISKPVHLRALVKIIQSCLFNDEEARLR